MEKSIASALLALLLSAGSLISQEEKKVYFNTPPVPLTAQQRAYLQQLMSFINCVIIFCAQFDDHGIPPWSEIHLTGNKDAKGGLVSFPDEIFDQTKPLFGGGVYSSDTGNVIAFDPGGFAAPAGGVATYWPGCGPNINGPNGPAGPAPGTTGDTEQNDGVAAAQLYGEIAHQNLVANYQVGGGPAGPVDDAARRASEARAYSRAAQFFLWMSDCEVPCWSNWGKTLSDEDKAKFAEKAQTYAEKAKRFGQ